MPRRPAFIVLSCLTLTAACVDSDPFVAADAAADASAATDAAADVAPPQDTAGGDALTPDPGGPDAGALDSGGGADPGPPPPGPGCKPDTHSPLCGVQACQATFERVGFVPPYARGEHWSVALRGDYAYVAFDRGLAVYDLGNAWEPTPVHWIPGDRISELQLHGDHLYAAGGWQGVAVYDLAPDPAVPEEIGRVEVEAHGFAVDQGLLYVVYDHDDDVTPSDFSVYDLSTLEAPAELYEPTGFLPPGARRVAVRDAVAWVAGQGAGLLAVDLAATAGPSLLPGPFLGGGDGDGEVEDVLVDGDHLWVAASEDGVHRMVVSGQGADTAASVVATLGGLGHAADVALDGARLVVADGVEQGGVHVYDVTDPAAPGKLYEVGDFDAFGVAAEGDRVVAVDMIYGLVVLDVSAASGPAEVGWYGDGGEAGEVVVHGTRAYVADEDGGLRIIDVSEPASPFERRYTWETFEAPVRDVALSADGGTALLATEQGIAPVTLHPTDDPEYSWTYQTAAGLSILAQGDRAWLGTVRGVLEVPVPPVPGDDPTWEIELGINVRGLGFARGRVFAAALGQGLVIIDPALGASTATVLGGSEATMVPVDVAAEGDRLYVTTRERIVLYDVSEPDAPQQLGEWSSIDISAARPSAGWLVVAQNYVGARLIDWRDPSAPKEREVIGTQGAEGLTDWADAVAVDGGRAYVVGGAMLLDVLEAGCSNPPAP